LFEIKYLSLCNCCGINLKLTYMKTVKFFLGALALAAVSMIVAPSVNAQENGNRDENGKIVRGPYLTNQFGDNWFIGVAGGMNFFGDGGYKPAVGGALDVNFGKWITPAIGLRAGYTGLTGAEWSKNPTVLGTELNADKDMYKQKFGFAYIHADVMWNISHAIGGYKETRLWNFVPYAHAGFLRTYGRAGAEFGDNEFAMGLGLLNNIRLCQRLDLTFDVRGLLMNGNHHAGNGGVAGLIQTTIGLSVNLGKTNWTRAANWHNPEDVEALDAAAASAAALAAANAALAAEKAELQKANEALEAKNNDLEKALAEAQANSGLKEVGPAAFYFEIGKTTLDKKELEHLDFYLKNVLPFVKGKTVTVITGSADKKTGTAKRNQYLCEKRAEYLKNLMVEKYGIDASDFAVRTVIATEGDASLSRAVVVSFE